MSLLLVMLGGGIGAGGRYLLGGWLHLQLGNGFPWGTFAVNALGSLLIGLVFGLAPGTTLFLDVGVLGGFTTFSTFSYETLRLSARSGLRLRSQHVPYGHFQHGVARLSARSLWSLSAFW